MTDLAAFLLARIAEDEADARKFMIVDEIPGGREKFEAIYGRHRDYVATAESVAAWREIAVEVRPGTEAEWAREASTAGEEYALAADHMVRWSPHRVLAECEAKRRIVELLQTGANACDACGAPYPFHDDYCGGYPGDDTRTLELLAMPYAGHPDYREEWRP